MSSPAYEDYSLGELYEALDSIDGNSYPKRLARIEAQIEQRRKEGYALTARTIRERLFPRNIPSYKVALPLWWSILWRTLVMNLVAAIPMGIATFLLKTVFSFIGLQEVFFQIASLLLFVTVNVVIGVLAVKQSLTSFYKNFHLEVFIRNYDTHLTEKTEVHHSSTTPHQVST